MRQLDDSAARETETIGARISRLRKEKGLKQIALTGPGVTPAQISRIESGKRRPSIKAIRRIAAKLEVTPEYLETGVDMTRREELEFELSELELRTRLDPSDETVASDLEELIELAQSEGMSDIGAKAHGLLGMVLEDRGHLSEAVQHLETAVESPLLDPCTHPDVYATLANAYSGLGRPGDAVVFCTTALERIPLEETASRTIIVTRLSSALSELGEFEQAEKVLEGSTRGIEDPDSNARAMMHWSLARLAAMRDDGRLALSHTHKAIALLKETEDTMRLARAHLLCATILLWGGKAAGVSKYLRLARDLFPEDADATDRGMLLGCEALIAARQGRFEEALSSAEEALALLPEHKLEQDAALCAKALALASRGEYEAADELFLKVIGVCETSKLWRQAALVSRDRAGVLRRAGKYRQSVEALERARDFESRIADSFELGNAR